MADMALGLTKRAVEGTVSRVLAAIDEDTKLKAAVQRDLQFIVDEFQMMQTFLKVAKNNMERTRNEVVRMWVRQLRELAFDVEDCVEFVTHLDTTSAQARKSWVWRVVRLPSCMTPAWVGDLDQAVAQLKLLKARVEEVSQRNTRYNLLGGDDSSGSSTTTSLPVSSDNTAFPSAVDILRDLWKANAKQSSSLKCNLKYLVADGPCNELRVISVWRCEGVDLEAAHILNTAYCDQEICEEFKARARVKLMQPFNIQEFLKSLLNQLYVTSHQQDTLGGDLLRTMGHSVIQDKLRELLSKHKYLVILEDLSSALEWDLIRLCLPDCHNGSRIIISTQQLGIALSCTGEPYRVLQLALLPNNDRYIFAIYKPFSIDITELVKQLGQRRVISLWGDEGGDTSSLVRDVYEAIRNKTAEFKGVKFGEQADCFSWINVPSPFSLEGFCRCLPRYVDDGYQDPKRYFAGFWSQKVCESYYLIVIEGLQSKEHWYEMKKAGLVPEDTKSCIVVIANEEAVAKHCEDDSSRKMHTNDAANFGPLFTQELSGGLDITELVKQLGQRRVIPLCGDEGGVTTSIVRVVYEAMENTKSEGVNFESLKWVKVPSTSLEGYFADLSEGLCESRCLIVIEGLQSKEDWDTIQDALVPEDTKSCIVIIANEEAVAKYCAEYDSSRKMHTNDAAIIGPLFAQKEKYYSWGHDRFGSHGCSRRIDESLFKFEPLITADQANNIVFERCKECRLSGVHVVWGATGVGKSALVRFVYYTVMAYSLKMIEETKIPKREVLLPMDPRSWVRFDRFGWVDVPEPFDLAEFSCRLLLDFNSNDHVEMEKTAVDIIQGHNPIQRCYETIRKQRSLVVIDGLRSTRDWDSIKQAFWCHHHPQSCIFVITIDTSIAQHCVNNFDGGDERTIPIRALDDKSALELFKKIAMQNNNNWTDRNWKHAERIVPKCGGLPKIIDAVAKSPCSFWENITDDLGLKLQNDPQFHHLRGLLSRMHSNFDHCSDSVKPCIFYLSVFPTNYKIRKAHLLRRWITEGYSGDTTGFSAKENAEMLFDELVKLGIIQELPRMPLCRISGLFHEYIISQPMEDNLVFALEGNCKTNSQRIVQHLTIMKGWEREHKNVFERIDVSRLRSLTVYGEWKPFFISEKMKRIRVLDLEGASGVEDCCLEHIFDILLSLKFICLRGCKSITCLPKTLGGLRQLESLDVSGTAVVTLPRAIIKLHKIQYVRAGRKFLPDKDCTSAASEDSDDAVGSQQPSGTTATPEAEGSDGGHQEQHQHHKKVGRRWTSRLSSQLSPLLPCGWFTHSNINGGVEVPEGIEDMPALHALGIVNINTARGKDFLKKLKDKTKFPQLLKLSVCGINKENWKDLCDAISALHHLESLSLGLDDDFTEDIYFGNPPKALKSFKVYGHIHRLPDWIKRGRLEANLEKFDIEAIISRQEGMDQLMESWPCTRYIQGRLCIKPTRQVRELEFKVVTNDGMFFNGPRVLKIDCRSTLEVAFQQFSTAFCVDVLIIHCSEGSTFRISSDESSGLHNLEQLNTVWLKGHDENAEYVAHLKEQVDAHPLKPVFTFEKLKSA